MNLLNTPQKIIATLILVLVICLAGILAYKFTFNSGFKAGEIAERTKIEEAVKESLEKQKKQLTEFYEAELEIERKKIKTEIIYIEAKSKIDELKKDDKSKGISKETAQKLNEIFKDLK